MCSADMFDDLDFEVMAKRFEIPVIQPAELLRKVRR